MNIQVEGYSYRPTYEEFLGRFRMLTKDKTKLTGTPKSQVEALLNMLDVEKSRVRLGISKLFMKEQEVISI